MKLETGSAYRPVVGLSTNGISFTSRIVQSDDARIVLQRMDHVWTTTAWPARSQRNTD